MRLTNSSVYVSSTEYSIGISTGGASTIVLMSLSFRPCLPRGESDAEVVFQGEPERRAHQRHVAEPLRDVGRDLLARVEDPVQHAARDAVPLAHREGQAVLLEPFAERLARRDHPVRVKRHPDSHCFRSSSTSY